MLRQEQFAKYVDAENPDFRNFDDEDAEVDVRRINPFISCSLCAGSYLSKIY